MDFDNEQNEQDDTSEVTLIDEFCALLHQWGVNARITDSEKVGERMTMSGRGVLLGAIEIEDTPIHWVHFEGAAETKWFQDPIERTIDYISGHQNYVIQSIEYGIPDSRLTPHSADGFLPQLRIRLRLDLVWHGNDVNLGIISKLNNDNSLKSQLVECPEVEIYADDYQSLWIISTNIGDIPTRELWDAYQAIARHLLAERSLG